MVVRSFNIYMIYRHSSEQVLSGLAESGSIIQSIGKKGVKAKGDEAEVERLVVWRIVYLIYDPSEYSM